jgi:ribose transport system substrate-binding protein
MTLTATRPQSKRFAFYGVDDEKTGRETMAELAKLTNGRRTSPSSPGQPEAPNLQRPRGGREGRGAKYPGIKIVGVFNHIETPQDASAEVVRVDNAYPGDHRAGRSSAAGRSGRSRCSPTSIRRR